MPTVIHRQGRAVRAWVASRYKVILPLVLLLPAPLLAYAVGNGYETLTSPSSVFQIVAGNGCLAVEFWVTWYWVRRYLGRQLGSVAEQLKVIGKLLDVPVLSLAVMFSVTALVPLWPDGVVYVLPVRFGVAGILGFTLLILWRERLQIDRLLGRV